MKQYYVRYTRNFANCYDLVYAETEQEKREAEENGWERVSRAKAFSLCADENYRRKHDPAFSGFASTVILPITYPAGDMDWQNDRHMVRDGYIVRRV